MNIEEAYRERREKCGGGEMWGKAFVGAWGSPDARVAIVSESPSSLDARHGRPFLGPVGDIVKDAVRESGHSPDREAYMTNIVKFERLPGGEFATVANMEKFRDLFLHEMKLLKPKVVVCLGAKVARVVIGLASTPRLGGMLDNEYGKKRGPLPGTTIIVTYSPRYIARGTSGSEPARHQLCTDIARAFEIAI